MKTVSELKNDDKGVWQVKTEASSYIIDLDERKFMRNPGEGAGPSPEIEGRTVRVSNLSSLFPDSEWNPLWEVRKCKIGSPMTLTSKGFSWVQSTIVRSIEQIVRND